MANEEKIGYHKGCLATLMKEREELSRMVGVVEQIMVMHMNALKELGVQIPTEQPKTPERKA